MVYTVVSRGRVLGTTELEYVRCMERSRAGSFWPAPGVENLIEIAVGVSPALRQAYKAGVFARAVDDDSRAARLARGKATTEHADLAAAFDHLDALDLELRGPDGFVIETESIGLQDTEYLLSVAESDFAEREWYGDLSAEGESGPDFDESAQELFEEDDSWDEDMSFELDDQPEKPFPRYQVFVRLLDEDDIP